MKKITFMAALLAVFTMNAQYAEDFESFTATDNVGEQTDLPDGFTGYDVDGDGIGFGLSNPDNFAQPFGNIYTGNFIASASFVTTGANGNGGNGALSPDNILVLPQLSLAAGSSPSFTYFVGSGTDPNFFSETYSVQVTTENTQDAIMAATPLLSTTLSFQGGEEVTIDLAAFAGMDVYISFRHFNTTDQWLLGLDNFNVSDASLGLSDVNNNGFFQYLDTAQNLNLRSTNGPLENIELYNILGQKVLSAQLSGDIDDVNINSLTKGVYVARVNVSGTTQTFKIIKN